MTKDERLDYCSICKNRKLDFKRGLLCGLTEEEADFEETCPSFTLDKERKLEKDGQGTYDSANGESVSPWRIVLSVILVTFAIIRIIMRLSNN